MANNVRLLFSLGILILILPSALSQEKTKIPEVKLYGEIIDPKCYLENVPGGGKGPEHRECAVKSAKSGMPLAFLEEKTEKVYFLARLNKLGSTNEMLIPFIAERVAITGKLIERGGARMILVDMVEKTN